MDVEYYALVVRTDDSSNYKAKVTYFDTFNDGRKIAFNVEIKVAAKPDAK